MDGPRSPFLSPPPPTTHTVIPQFDMAVGLRPEAGTRVNVAIIEGLAPKIPNVDGIALRLSSLCGAHESFESGTGFPGVLA